MVINRQELNRNAWYWYHFCASGFILSMADEKRINWWELVT